MKNRNDKFYDDNHLFAQNRYYKAIGQNMKHGVAATAILLIVYLLFGCSSKTDPTPPPDKQVINDGSGAIYDADDVSIWDKTKSYSGNSYFTSTDTTYGASTLGWPVFAYIDQTDSLRVSWQVNNKPYSLVSFTKAWNPSLQKWKITSNAIIDFTVNTGTFPIKASLYFRNANKTILRDATLIVTRNVIYNDVFRVNFGMTKDDVKINELDRLQLAQPGNWLEVTPSLSLLGTSSNFPGYTFYEFDNGQLKIVSECTDVYTLTDSFIKRLTKLRIPQTPKLVYNSATQTYILDKTQVWNNNKLKFTLQQRNFQFGPNTIRSVISITYEKF